MRYNVSQLLKEPIGATRGYQLDEDLEGPDWYADKASGQVQMLRTHQGVLVKAALEIRSTSRCGRCLGEFGDTVELMIEEEFYPTMDLHTGMALPLPEDVEGSVVIDSDHILDLATTLSECIVAALPMKPLCGVDCSGLCQVCGINKNIDNCGCSVMQGDPRWRGLQGLAKELRV